MEPRPVSRADFDLPLQPADVTAVSSADAVAQLFARLGYPTNARSQQRPDALGFSQRLTSEVRHVERIAADLEDFFQVFLVEVRSLTAAVRAELAKAYRDRAGDFLLVLTTPAYDTIELALLRRETRGGETSLSKLRVHAQLRTLGIERRQPTSRAIRVLRRFTWTEVDPFAQVEKLGAAFDLADWSEDLFNNRGLFSDHYLLRRLPEDPDWRDDPKPAYLHLRDIFRRAGIPEDEEKTRRSLLEPTLVALGFTLRPGKRAGSDLAEPDYHLLGEDGEELGLCLAYPWNRFLDGKDTQRDRESPEENPGALVVSLLSADGPGWAIVTNGRLWRLYSGKRHGRATTYFEIDLHELLVEGLPGIGPGDAFRYFWLLFRRRAFEAREEMVAGSEVARSFLNRLLDESAAYARDLGERLKEQVFEEVFPALAEGFASSLWRDEDVEEARLREVHQATLTLLYRLLFILYAESRALLPLHESSAYFAASLQAIKDELAETAGSIADERDARLAKQYAQDKSTLWPRLLRLFRVIDRGDGNLNVPAYNGGLFLTDPAPDDERPEAVASRFLERVPVPDLQLARALDRLSRNIDPKRHDLVPIDYRSLGVRQLGSIYEGLLEFRLRVAKETLIGARQSGRDIWLRRKDATERQQSSAERSGRIRSSGELYLENDRHERKASGSYYTPDAIVEYIVEAAVGPALTERFDGLRPVLRQAQQWHQRKLAECVAKGEAPEKYTAGQAVLHEWRTRLIDPLLDIKVLDPAMGSGHFLVEAVDLITDRTLEFLNAFPWNPVQVQLAESRREILEATERQQVAINPQRLTDVHLLQRQVLKRCLYGVDLNPMAVELAKVSLWLHCFTLGAPLSFLDHHLRSGNSLLAVEVKEAREAVERQRTLFGSPFTGLMLAAETMREIGELPDATAEQVIASRERYREVTDTLAPVRRILDVYASQWFGNGVERRRNRQGEGAETQAVQLLRSDAADHLFRVADPLEARAATKRLPQPYREVAERALDAAREHRFFHWQVEFPEVFLGRDGRLLEEAGFNAVVGNPPYVRMELIKPIKPFLKARFKAHEERADLFIYFYELMLHLCRPKGRSATIASSSWTRTNAGSPLRKLLQEQATLDTYVDFGDLRVFEEATTYPCIAVFRREPAPPEHPVRAVEVTSLEELDLSALVRDHATRVPQAELRGPSWRFEDQRLARLREKIERAGMPLKDYCGSPLYGIKTGLNEAFVIDQATRDALVAADASSEEILKSFLEGKDLKPWRAEWPGQWLIYTHHGIDIRRYPAIREHLLPFKKRLEERATAANHEWYELQQPQVAYSARMLEPKIVYPEFSSRPKFSMDLTGLFFNNKVYFVPSPTEDYYLLGLLHSCVTWFSIQGLATAMRGGNWRFELFTQVMERVSIPKQVVDDTRCLVANLAKECTALRGSDVTGLEMELDRVTSALFGLTDEESRILSERVPGREQLA